MSNYNSQIYKKLGTILVIKLIYIFFTDIIFRFIPIYYYIPAISSILAIFSIILMIFWVIHLSKLYQASKDSSVKSASKLFLAGLIVEVIRILVIFFLGFLAFIANGDSADSLIYIGVYYLPFLVINFLNLFAWVKLAKHFKTTLVSTNGKTGCTLIYLSKIPSILVNLAYIVLIILSGPIYEWDMTLLYTTSIIFSYIIYLGIFLELVGYIVVIWVFKKTNIPQSTMTHFSPDNIERNNIAHEEPTLNNPRFCTQCGAPTVPGATFCNQCGQTM